MRVIYLGTLLPSISTYKRVYIYLYTPMAVIIGTFLDIIARGIELLNARYSTMYIIRCTRDLFRLVRSYVRRGEQTRRVLTRLAGVRGIHPVYIFARAPFTVGRWAGRVMSVRIARAKREKPKRFRDASCSIPARAVSPVCAGVSLPPVRSLRRLGSCTERAVRM